MWERRVTLRLCWAQAGQAAIRKARRTNEIRSGREGKTRRDDPSFDIVAPSHPREPYPGCTGGKFWIEEKEVSDHSRLG